MNTRLQGFAPGGRVAHCVALATLLTLALGGCGSISGLGGESRYACKAPEGVACDSVSGTYANAIRNNLPSQRRTSVESPVPAAVASSAPRRTAPAPAPATATPDNDIQSPGLGALRSPARVLRLWTKPWEDADGDLYDQGYVYVQIHDGQWLIDHVQRRIRDAYAPLRPPANAATDVGADAAQDSSSGSGLAAPSRPRPADAAFPSPGLRPAGASPAPSFNRAP
jgi:conjugal transfer pilus assembly protein TraV